MMFSPNEKEAAPAAPTAGSGKGERSQTKTPELDFNMNSKEIKDQFQIAKLFTTLRIAKKRQPFEETVADTATLALIEPDEVNNQTHEGMTIFYCLSEEEERN